MESNCDSKNVVYDNTWEYSLNCHRYIIMQSIIQYQKIFTDNIHTKTLKDQYIK